MKRKIIIAGAGHGGLVCGALLAEQGFDVTVYEKNGKKEVGHDWMDVFPLSCFTDAGIPLPPRSKCERSHSICYTNPNKTVKIQMPEKNSGSVNSVLDRKYLINYLIRFAAKKGVKFRFNSQIICPISDGGRVLGLTVKRNGRLYSVFADLIIDAAGMDSPVRRLLPSCIGIENEFSENQIFTAYRAFYEKVPGKEPENKYTVHLFHMHEPGISWVISERNHYDVLIGRFGGTLTQEQIDNSAEDLRESYPSIGKNILRGGQTSRIPIRRTIPMIVADGYAAIGDSAAMTIPIIGSGIANSIRAGKYLFDAVIADTEGLFTAETLWRYQYEYFTKIGNNLVVVDKLRSVCTKLTGDDVDYLLEKNILSANELSLSDKSGSALTASDIVQKLIKSLPKVSVIANLTKTFARHGTLKRVLAEMPEEYSKEEVDEWTAKYAVL